MGTRCALESMARLDSQSPCYNVCRRTMTGVTARLLTETGDFMAYALSRFDEARKVLERAKAVLIAAQKNAAEGHGSHTADLARVCRSLG